jgi:hypothetical protein
MDIATISAVIQLSRNPAPMASTLCSQAIVRSNGKTQLIGSVQFLHLPEYMAKTGEVIAASSIDPPQTLNPRQTEIAIAVHRGGVCVTPKMLVP